MGFTLNHKKSITNGEWLSSDHINAAMELLKKKYPNVAGLQDVGNVPIRDKGKWTYFRKFDKCTTCNTKTVQINYDSSHFIVSAKLPGDPIVYLLGSSNSSKLSEGIRLQLSSQYGLGKISKLSNAAHNNSEHTSATVVYVR